MLIDDHDSEDEPAVEGMEAFGADAHDDVESEKDPEEDDEEDEDDVADGGAGDGSQPSSDDGGSDGETSVETNYSQTSAESDSDADDGHGGAGVEGVSTVPVAEAPLPSSEVPSGSQPSSEVPSSEATRAKAELDAYLLLFDEAKRNTDDTALKFFRNRIAGKVRDQKEGVSEAGTLLRKRAQDQHEEFLKSAKRYKEEERIAARKEKDQKIT